MPFGSTFLPGFGGKLGLDIMFLQTGQPLVSSEFAGWIGAYGSRLASPGKPKVCEGRRHMFQMPILKLTPQLKHRGLIYAMEDHDLKTLTASPEKKTLTPTPTNSLLRWIMKPLWSFVFELVGLYACITNELFGVFCDVIIGSIQFTLGDELKHSDLDGPSSCGL